MHMLLVIVGGLVMLGLFALFGWLWGANPVAVARAAGLFIPAWAVVALVNMWVGVNRAGYGVREELPILLIVFAVPSIVAAILWYLGRP